jgi:hypothetical protein
MLLCLPDTGMTEGKMKRIIMLGITLIMMVTCLSGCFIPYDDRDGGRRHDGRDRHDRGDRHDRDGRR